MSETKKRFVTWFELNNRCRMIADMIAQDPNYQAIPDIHLMAIGSGGWIPARLISGYLQQKGCGVTTSSISVKSYENKKQRELKIQSIPSTDGEPGSLGDTSAYHLIVDDLVDSGDTMDAVWRLCKEQWPDVLFDTAVVFYKPHSLWKPNVFAELVDSGEWIVFPYETEDQL